MTKSESEVLPHVAYFTHQFPPEVGAGASRVAEFALRWQASGASVTIVTGMPNRPEGRVHKGYRGRLVLEESWRGIRVLRSWLFATPRAGFVPTVLNNVSFAATIALHAALRGNRFDVVIASSPPFFVHLAGDFVSRVRGIPLVLELRDLWPDYMVDMGVLRNRAGTRALFACERYLLGRAARVVVVTSSFRRRVIEKGVDAELTDLIPNGVDTTQYFRQREAVPIAALERRGEEFLVGYLGNFGAGQGLESVIDAAARLASTDPQVRFVLAGDGTHKSRVVAMVRERRVTNLTIHSTLPRDETRAFYNACDACLVPLAPIPIFQDTIPSKIFEIMACECPVIASLDGEGARIVRESGGGVLARPGDSQGIADAIRKVKAMGVESRRQLGRGGRAFVSRHYQRNVLADRYLEVLSQVHGSYGLSKTQGHYR